MGQAAQPPDFPIVALGASAGGLKAYTRFLEALSPKTGMGFILIQHMDPTHESILASLLQKTTKMPVREATEGTLVEPDHVYIVPPNSLMTISQRVLSLTSRGLRSFKDYPIDRFFLSLAKDLGNKAIGVVLSGTASDGTRGLLAIKAEGGITFAQDVQSAQFSSMPASSIASGCVDFTLPPEAIAEELARMSGHPYIRRLPRVEQPESMIGTDGIRTILRQLRFATGVDFELYKPAMIGRRVARRMALHRLTSHDDYAELIRKDRAELNALYEDIFIHVTGFFRDPETFKALQRRVLRDLAAAKGTRTIRVWVPGCSSGEEVYSIAMLLFETLGARRHHGIQIFGSDISDKSIQKARAGIYPASSMVDVSAYRRRRFFTRVDGNYQISKELRDVCVFARHDLTKDPPFSRMDLISCRNVLIYMGPALQQKAIEAFHYSLKPGGYLLLGKSESLGAYSSLFAKEDSVHKILVRRPSAPPRYVHDAVKVHAQIEKPPEAQPQEGPVWDVKREAERLLLGRYSPPAVVVDPGLQIIHFQGDTSPFLAPPSGEPSFHLLRMIRPELLADMRSAIHQAKRQREPVRRTGVRVKDNGRTRRVDIEVAPIRARSADENEYLVVFRETPEPELPLKRDGPSPISKDRVKAELDRRDRDIAALREQLQDLIQDHEAADEEVRASNEEILSSNEELQSANEELETAKEELESTNEELNTLNDELQKRNADLTQIMSDLSNLLVGINIPIVLLDSELRVRRFTPAAGTVLNLISADLGRPLSDLAPTLQSVSWKNLQAQMERRREPLQMEVQDLANHWYTLRMWPFRDDADRLTGVLIALFDVDAMKRSLEEAQTARKRAEDLEARITLAAEGMPIGLWEYDVAADTLRGTKAWAVMYGFQPDQAVSREQWLARVHPDDHAMLQESLNRVISTGKRCDSEFRVIWPDGSLHWVNRRGELVHDEKGKPTMVRGVSLDITDQKMAESERQAFASRIASAQEGERRRIARELHDGLIQDLAALAMDLGRRVSEPPAPGPELTQDYRSFQNRVINAAETARHVAYNLHPTELDDLGLEKALRAYCQQFAGENGIVVDFATHKLPSNIRREIASSLYKVAQEALRNVAKHTRVERAKVVVERVDRHVRLSVEDKGKGFSLSSLKNSTGLGVASMRERIRLVNGKLDISSEPGMGTRVTAEVPLEKAEDSK